MVWTENAALLLERFSTNHLCFRELVHAVKRVDEEALCVERAHVVRPERAGQCGERRPQQRRRLRVLSEREKRDSQVRGGAQSRGVLLSVLPRGDVQAALL